MDLLQAIILGIIQGITEFLPISSTGHLTVTGRLMGLISTESPEHWTAFIAVIQLGTLVSILIYFFKDIQNIVKDFLYENINFFNFFFRDLKNTLSKFYRNKLIFKRIENPFRNFIIILKNIWDFITDFPNKEISFKMSFVQQSENSKMGWMIIIGTIPVVIIGLSFKHVIEGEFTKNLYVIACSLILLAIILAIAEKKAKFKKEMKDITIKDAIIIGFSQSLALIPGSSRSGTTITGGLFMGLTRETAARFSFLLSIPAVFASGMLELVQALKYIQGDMITNLVVSTIVSGISGYIAIDFLLKYLKKNSTFLFIYYRIAAGVFILILLLTNNI